MSPGWCEGTVLFLDLGKDFGYVLVETPVPSTASSWEAEIDTWLVTHVYAHFSKLVCVLKISGFLFLASATEKYGE